MNTDKMRKTNQLKAQIYPAYPGQAGDNRGWEIEYCGIPENGSSAFAKDDKWVRYSKAKMDTLLPRWMTPACRIL